MTGKFPDNGFGDVIDGLRIRAEAGDGGAVTSDSFTVARPSNPSASFDAGSGLSTWVAPRDGVYDFLLIGASGEPDHFVSWSAQGGRAARIEASVELSKGDVLKVYVPAKRTGNGAVVYREGADGGDLVAFAAGGTDANCGGNRCVDGFDAASVNECGELKNAEGDYISPSESAWKVTELPGKQGYMNAGDMASRFDNSDRTGACSAPQLHTIGTVEHMGSDRNNPKVTI